MVASWARAKVCQWGEGTCISAEGGHLDVLAMGACQRLSVERGHWIPARGGRCSGCVPTAARGTSACESHCGGHLPLLPVGACRQQRLASS
jgi:hypothetical protein